MMPAISLRRLGALSALCLSTVCVAQSSGGRTDGAEGSEIGHGGYDRASGNGKFALAFDFGAELHNGGPLSGSTVPLYLGGTASLWLTDWFLMDLTGIYGLATKRIDAMIGPRFRTWTWPVSFSAGIRAGPMIDTLFGTRVRFGLSPMVAADFVFARHLMLGLQLAVDIPLGGDPSFLTSSSTRIGLNFGWRF